MANLIIEHNFDPDQFMWLWAKYAFGFNPKQHCTNSIKGKYSRKFSKPNNPHLKIETRIAFDEMSLNCTPILRDRHIALTIHPSSPTIRGNQRN